MKKKTGPKPDGIKRRRTTFMVYEEVENFASILSSHMGWSFSQAINHLCTVGLNHYAHHPLPDEENKEA